MRHRVLVLALVTLIAGVAYAADVPLTLERTGNCSSDASVKLIDVATGNELASCGANCERVTIDVPVDTWVRVSLTANTHFCGGSANVRGEAFFAPQPRIGRSPAGRAFRVGSKGNVVKAAFTYQPPRLPSYIPPGNQVK